MLLYNKSNSYLNDFIQNKKASMKYLTFALCNLIAINTVSAMDETKQITIHNDKIDKIGILFKHYVSSDHKDLGYSRNSKNDIPKNNSATFDLITRDEFFSNELIRLVPELFISNAMPQKITLNITDAGPIAYGETITI